jgi:tripartite-type tricarboxylate transporter receptor subunit TctC
MNKLFDNRLLLGSAVALLALPAATAQAEYPEKEITMIVNAGAGGSTSGGARILAKAMEKSLGQPVVVVSKPGGSGAPRAPCW